MRLLPTRRLCTASVRVADVTVKVSAAKTPHLVPHAFAAAGSPAPPQHLRWMAQKEALGQDVLLIGPPGGQKRQLALRWAEVAGREVESLALSSDTTEADLKQRRQVLDGNVYYVDAAPVRAAIAGRLLLLDGVEKAERNVLPTLNNLLENREMGLPDGRFLMSPARFDALLASGDHTHASLAARGYVRVHHDFRVIATGLPVPAFAGFPLDPPLRSRFQGLFCGVPPPALQLASVRALLSSSREAAPRGAAQSLVSWAEAVRAAARGSGGGQAEGRLLHLSDCSLRRAARVLASFPAHYDCGGGDALPPLLHRSFPHRLMGLEAPEAAGVAAAFEAAGMPPPSQLQGQRRPASVVEPDGAVVEGVIAGQGVTARVGLGCTRGVEVPVGALHGTASGGAVGGGEAWVETPALRACLLAMAEDHASGAHLCLVGAAGGGKSALAHRFGAAFGYRVRTVPLYRKKKTSHPLPPGCTLVSQQGLWTNFILDVPVRDHKYVAILMDDVDASNVDLASFVRTLEAHSLDMAAAAVDSRWHWTVMMPSEDNCVVREVQYADTLFSVFKAKSFECWRGQIDLTVNPSGWGYDATFPSRCGASIGVLDHWKVEMGGDQDACDQ